MQLDIITPEKIIYSGDASEILAMTETGQIGILPHHVPLFTRLVPGELVITSGNKKDTIAVAGGFLHVKKDTITVLADYAIRAEEIEVAKAQEAKARAEKMLAEQKDRAGQALAEAQLRRSLLELHVAQRRRKTPSI